MVKIIDGKEFEAITASNAENNSIFLDSSDNKLKTKDNSGSVSEISKYINKITSTSSSTTVHVPTGRITCTLVN